MTATFDIERVVEEVVRRLQQMQETESQPAGLSTGIGVLAANSCRDDDDAATITLEDRVVTLRTLDARALLAKRLIVPSQAIVTPAAADLLRAHGIAIQRGDAPRRKAPCPLPSIRAAAGAVGANPAAEAPLRLRIISTAVGSPATSVAPPNERNIHVACADLGGVQPAVRDLVDYLSHRQRPEVPGMPLDLGVIMTAEVATAICEANRHPQVRAAWGVDLASVTEAIRGINANLLVIDPSRSPLAACRNMIRHLVNHPRQPLC